MTGSRTDSPPLSFSVCYSITRMLARICLARVSFTFEGLENIPASGGAVLAANHPCALDYFVMVRAVKRGFCCMQRKENFAHPLLDWWLRRLRAFPVGTADENRCGLEFMERWLKSGMLHLQGPEGDVSGEHTLRFRSGFVRLARDAGVPVIPVAIVGSDQCLVERHRPKGFRQFVPRPCGVRVRFFPAMAVPEEVRSKQDCQDFADAVRAVIVAELPDHLRLLRC